MLRNTLLFAGLAAVSAWAGADEAVPDAPLVVIDRSMSFAKDAFPEIGQWYGLYCQALDCELKPVDVSVNATAGADAAGEDQTPEVLGVEGEPLALFHGVDLNAGPVTTWYTVPEHLYLSGQYTSLLRLGRWQVPGLDDPLTLSWVQLPDGAGRHYFLGNGTLKQLLFGTAEQAGASGDTTPVIHWVGDLDGDGKPDLLLSLPQSNCGYEERLYLSSQAEAGELVHKAAMRSGTQPGCGC
jgi:hypothetical protein